MYGSKLKAIRMKLDGHIFEAAQYCHTGLSKRVKLDGPDFQSKNYSKIMKMDFDCAILIDSQAPGSVFAKNQHFLISMKRNKIKTTDQI